MVSFRDTSDSHTNTETNVDVDTHEDDAPAPLPTIEEVLSDTQTTHLVETERDSLGAVQRDGNAMTLKPGMLAGDYIIRSKIGWGGCSTVYSARHRRSNQEVAVKVMHPGLAESPRQVQRFVQEAKAIRAIQHPSMVRIYDIGRLPHSGRPYIVMELLHGANLSALLRSRGRFSPNEALDILAPVTEALGMAHEAGIIHRDIKASNIIVLSEGGSKWQIKLLDFGIAKLLGGIGVGSMQTTVGHVLGTPHSMAPEQIRGQPVDARTDIYALGALLYRLLTGHHPFEGFDALALTRMHIHSPPPAPSQTAPVPPALDAVVRKAMEKQPDQRYQTALEFIHGLRQAIGSHSQFNVGRAIGLYVEARINDGGEVDDAVVDDLMNILDLVEHIFTEHTFSIPFNTGNAILGALPVSEDNLQNMRAKAMDLATELEYTISSRSFASTRVGINLCLHIDDATLRKNALNHTDVVGGPIVDIGAWAPQQMFDGVCVTAEMLGMANSQSGDGERTYVRLTTTQSLRPK